MSADNWTYCPKCYKEGKSRDEKLRDAYGKVKHNDYMILLDTAKDDVAEPTLREDYGIGIVGGEFDVSYSGHCQRCGFTFKYAHTEAVS